MIEKTKQNKHFHVSQIINNTCPTSTQERSRELFFKAIDLFQMSLVDKNKAGPKSFNGNKKDKSRLRCVKGHKPISS